MIAGMTRRLSSSVFVGRSKELQGLLATAELVASGAASVTLIGGEAGVGKSRLVAEVATRLRGRGWLVLEGGSSALGDDGLPFEPIVEALRDLACEVDPERIAAAAGPSLPDLARLIPDFAGGVGEAPVAGAQADWMQIRIFEGILRLLGRLGENTPVLLIVEDLHWADRSTRDLLAYLARNTHAERLFTIATFRVDELHRRHPLTAWLAESERQPRTERIELARFERAEVGELLTGIAGLAPAASLVDSIARRSDGNAFFAEELAAAVDATGHLHERLPDTLREILAVRLSMQSEAAGRLIGVAAVAGRQVDHEVLAHVCGLSDPELQTALREAVDAQILVADRDQTVERYRFRHALAQEAAYDDLLPAERRGLHVEYARALEAQPAGTGVEAANRLVELAHHWMAVHDPGRALSAAVAAGDASRGVYAYAAAARQYEHAIELWDAVAVADRPRDRDLGDLYGSASDAATAIGDAARAVNLARRASELVDGTAERDGDTDVERRAAARERFAIASALTGDADTSLRLLREAVGLLKDAPSSIVKARVLSGLATQVIECGSWDEAVLIGGSWAGAEWVAESAIEIARIVGDRGIESRAMRTLGNILADRGNVEAGITLLRRSLALAVHDADPSIRHRAYNSLSSILGFAGLIEEAVEVALAGADSIRRYGGELSYVTFLEDNAAEGMILLGRYPEAAALLEVHLAHVPRGRAIHLHFTRAHLDLRQGDLISARRHLEIARSEAGDSPDSHMVFDVHTFGAEIAVWGGRPKAALAIAQDVFDKFIETGLKVLPAQLAIPAIHAAADLAVQARAARDPSGAHTAATAARDIVERYRAWESRMAEPDALASRQIAWKTALLEAELARAMGEDDPANWDLARTALAARTAPFLESYVLWRAADAFAGRGDRAAAAEPLRNAYEIAARIGARLLVARIEALGRRMRIKLTAPDAGRTAAETPPLVERNEPFGLTTREREVLALVAQGYTNHRIADTLFITESTAGVHVSHILGKLDVGSRTEAATVAVRLGLDDITGFSSDGESTPTASLGGPSQG
jgi:DNA-binding CsgD family transcriptional regulator